jgi:hypothetical protein
MSQEPPKSSANKYTPGGIYPRCARWFHIETSVTVDLLSKG